ncbi:MULTISPECIES: hypothetical protein [unclassified Microcoleus]
MNFYQFSQYWQQVGDRSSHRSHFTPQHRYPAENTATKQFLAICY